MQLEYQNKHGRVTFALVTSVLPVKDIRGANVDNLHKFDIELAEKIVLITDNRGIQICPCRNPAGGWHCYVVLHDSPSTAAVAKVESINYIGGNPAKEIRDARTSLLYNAFHS